MKVAFHAINGVGLGHLVRTTTLARAMCSRAPGLEVLFLTNAGDVTLLEEAGFPYVRLPPRASEPHADPDRVRTALPDALEEVALEAALQAFAPDLVVFDTHAPMALVKRLAARTVLVLRELRPEALRGLDASAFDRILVPHEPGEIDLPFPATFVGPIVRALPRRRPKPNTVVALAGGGGQPVDAERYVRAVADAHCLLRARRPALETTLVVGPYGVAPPWTYPGLRVVRAPRDLAARLARAELVVSQAGYNAVAELRSLEKPAVLVPGHRKAEDQRLRARRLARTGAAIVARPEARSIADAMARAFDDLPAMREAHRRHPLVDRSDVAAEAALRLLRRPAGPVRKVMLVAHDYAPKRGGMETVARGIATELRAKGLDVRVLTSQRLGSEELAVFEPLPPPLRIDLTTDLFVTIAEALRDPPDVIHLCHAGLAPWVPALRAALPSVVSVSVHGNDLLAPWVNPGRLPDHGAACVEGMSAADAVIAVSAFSRDLAAARGVSRPIDVVENGIDTARFTGPAPEANLPFAPDAEVVLTVSRLTPRKGHRTAIEALGRLRRPRLVYAFTGASETLRAELARHAATHGVALAPLGFVTDERLVALYRRANAFVFLAESDAADVEGFGVALLEAAASGLPIVAANGGGVPEAVGDAAILVPPRDPAAAAEALRSLLDDPAAARELGAKARARALAFTATRAAERMLAIWNAAPRHAVDPDVTLLREARTRDAARTAERARRREQLRRGPVRLRATGDGARLLPAALEDCRAVGQRPIVALKLRRWLEPDFQAHADVEAVELVHGLPHAPHTLAQLRALPPEALAKVRSLRLHLAPDADPIAAVPDAHALRKMFAAAGATVVPPPELMRWLSETPALGPSTAMIEPTNLCNLACPTCPTGTGKIPPLPQMTQARFEHALAAVGPLRNLALWNYGEPLLNRELPAMIAHAKKAGVGVVKVSSNVHFLDGARGTALLASGLDVLILSVDGASPETYATFRKEGDFARVASAVAWLCAEKKRLGLVKPRIELQFIVMRHNEHELPEMRRLARAWGVDKLRIKTVGADDAASRDLVPASRLLSRYAADGETPNVRHPFCTMAWDHAVVNVDGSVTPCCYLRPDMGDAFVMGNVFDAPWPEIWRGERYRAFRAKMLDGRADMPVCSRCRGGTHDLVAATEEVPA